MIIVTRPRYANIHSSVLKPLFLPLFPLVSHNIWHAIFLFLPSILLFNPILPLDRLQPPPPPRVVFIYKCICIHIAAQLLVM